MYSVDFVSTNYAGPRHRIGSTAYPSAHSSNLVTLLIDSLRRSPLPTARPNGTRTNTSGIRHQSETNGPIGCGSLPRAFRSRGTYAPIVMTHVGVLTRLNPPGLQ